MKRLSYLSYVCVCLIFASGCSTQLPELPETDVPQQWNGPSETQAQVWPALDWWNNFNYDELSLIIQRVKENNFDLANNRRNLEAARLTLVDAGLDLWPAPNVSVGANYSKSSSGDNVGGINIDSLSDTRYSASATLSYNNILSKPTDYDRSLAQYDNSVASAVDTALNTLRTAAASYFNILLIRDQISDAEQNLQNAEVIANIAQARVDAGIATPIEALQQRIAVENQRTNIRNLRQQELSARAALALLVGEGVVGFDVQGQTLEDVVVPTVQPGIPAELLTRRPDLVRAEASLRTSRANVDLARLAFLPNISLTAGINGSSDSLSEVLESPVTLITGSLVETLFDNGGRIRNTKRARLELESSLANYRKAVISAFNDVEVTLNNIALLDDLANVRAEDLARAEESFRIAQVRYREGAANYETVLVAQNSLFTTRNSYLNNKRDQLSAILNFYQALGGGWQSGDETILAEVVQ